MAWQSAQLPCLAPAAFLLGPALPELLIQSLSPQVPRPAGYPKELNEGSSCLAAPCSTQPLVVVENKAFRTKPLLPLCFPALLNLPNHTWGPCWPCSSPKISTKTRPILLRAAVPQPHTCSDNSLLSPGSPAPLARVLGLFQSFCTSLFLQPVLYLPPPGSSP